MNSQQFNFDEFEDYVSSETEMPLVSDSFNFEDFEDAQEEPSNSEQIKEAFKESQRFVLRNAASAASSLLGIPANLVSATKWLQSKLSDVPAYLQQDETFVQSFGKNVLNTLPTTQDIRNTINKLTGGFTEPQNDIEEFGDEVVGLATDLSVGSNKFKTVKDFLKLLGTATAAKGGRKGAEVLFGEDAGTLAELGILFATGLQNQPKTRELINRKYTNARNNIPPNTMLSTAIIDAKLSNLENELSRGISTATKSEVKSAIKDLRGKTSLGQIEAADLVDAYHDINERISSKGLFDTLSKTERKLLRKRYDDFKTVVGEELKDYGTNNPNFYTPWKEGNEAYATLEQSKTVSNWIKKIDHRIPKAVQTGIAYSLFSPKAAAGLIGGATALKTSELMYRIAKSPVLRKHYLNTVNAAVAENGNAFIKNIGQLDKELKKEFENEYYIN